MSNLLIYIEDQLLILKSGTRIAYTYQNTFLSDLGRRYASYSKQITAPFCPENDLILGFARFEKSQAREAYRILRARVIRNGKELPLNNCIVIEADEGYKLDFFDGIKGIFDAIGDKTIDNLSSINPNLVTWNGSALDTYRNAAVGLVTPFINYGQISREDLVNGSLDSETGWEQFQRTPDDSFFADGGSYLYAELHSFATTLTEQDGTTVLLRQRYKFSPGQEYEITLTHNWEFEPTYAKAYLMKESGELLEVISDVQATPTTASVTITPTEEYQFIALAGLLPPPPATNSLDSDIRLHNVSVTVKLKVATPYLPSVYYHSILRSIYSEAGYSLDSTSILSDDIFNRVILPFSKDRFEFTGFFNECREFVASLTESVPFNATSGNIAFDQIDTKDLFGFYDPTSGIYDSDAAYQPIVTYDTRAFYAKFYCRLEIVLISGSATLAIVSQGYGSMDSFTISSPGRHTIFLAANEFDGDNNGFNIFGGDQVAVNVSAGSGNIIIVSGEFSNKVNGINQEETTPVFYACEILPPMPQKDFLKDFLIRFAIVPYEFNGNVSLKTVSEIIASRSLALDWTAKRDTTFKDKVYFNRRYAKKNHLTYPSNDDRFNPYFSNGSIDVENETLEEDLTLYESIFNGSSDMSLDADSTSISVGFIPIYESAPTQYPTANNDDNFNAPGYRIMIARTKKSSEPTVEYNGNDRSDYLIGSFLSPNESIMGWNGFIERGYQGAIDPIRTDKGVIRQYILSEEDVSKVNPHTIMYDDGSYFWIEKIFDHDPEFKTKVLLFKI